MQPFNFKNPASNFQSLDQLFGGAAPPINPYAKDDGTYTVTLRDNDTGQPKLVTLALSNSEVHVQQAMGDMFAGFSTEGYVADLVAPVVLVDKQSDYFWRSPLSNTFDEAIFAPAGNSGGYNEINPTFTTSTYQCVEYALGAFLPTQLEQNADSTLDLALQYGRLLADRFEKREEVAVATKLQSSASYDAALVDNVGTTANRRWLDLTTGIPGANSDPVKDIQDLMLKSILPVTHAIMNERVYNAFMRHPKVQAYTQYKDGYAPFVAPDALWKTLNLPIPVLARAKKNPVSGLPDYIWGGNHVSLIHKYDPSRVKSGTDTANLVRIRWKAGYQRIPGATVVNGMASRMFFNEYRGFAGGKQLITMVAQDEFTLETKVGGLLQNVLQLP